MTRGVHSKFVQETLGLASITITLDLYSHVLPDMQEKAMRVMEDLLAFTLCRYGLGGNLCSC
jgi:hypothetical protein